MQREVQGFIHVSEDLIFFWELERGAGLFLHKAQTRPCVRKKERGLRRGTEALN